MYNGESHRKQQQRQRRRRNVRSAIQVAGALLVAALVAVVAWWPSALKAGARPNHLASGASGNTQGAGQTQGSGTVAAVAGTTPKTGNGSVEVTALPASTLIHVKPQDQLPQLPNGCEITSLSMLFSSVGHPVSRYTLAKVQPYDKTPEVFGKNGSIVSWGNPNVGFVGSVYNHSHGYGIYHGPLVQLINKILPGKAVDLTGHPFNDILRYVAEGRPVEMWVTYTFKPTVNWITWKTPEGNIRVTLDEHAVLLVGYDANHFFINNPLNGVAAQAVAKGPFLQAWQQLGRQAVTIAR